MHYCCEMVMAIVEPDALQYAVIVLEYRILIMRPGEIQCIVIII